jgi:hypothetical protein
MVAGNVSESRLRLEAGFLEAVEVKPLVILVEVLSVICVELVAGHGSPQTGGLRGCSFYSNRGLISLSRTTRSRPLSRPLMRYCTSLLGREKAHDLMDLVALPARMSWDHGLFELQLVHGIPQESHASTTPA